MAKRGTRSVLFLCTGNYYRSRFAEVLFNHVAAKMGAAWQASSRALALERGIHNVGPMASAAVQALEQHGIRAAADCTRLPAAVTADDLQRAAWIVALSDVEHRPLVLERWPAFADKLEYWEVADAPDALPLIEREVMDLLARLMSGGRPRVAASAIPEPPQGPPALAKPMATVRVGRETRGRRGSGVTTVFDLPLSAAEIDALAARLKQQCGTGGTVKDGRIEIQGDQRDRVTALLEQLGYRVKRTGG